MIRDVKFDTSPIHPGEKRPLQAWADTRMTVAIKCFTKAPPPPGYKACPSCGEIKMDSGETTYVEAHYGTFERAKDGRLDVKIRDLTGDERAYHLRVLEIEEEAPRSMEAGA